MLGSIFALTSAFFWASAVILFKKSGETFSPISLNIYKSFVALMTLLIYTDFKIALFSTFWTMVV